MLFPVIVELHNTTMVSGGSAIIPRATRVIFLRDMDDARSRCALHCLTQLLNVFGVLLKALALLCKEVYNRRNNEGDGKDIARSGFTRNYNNVTGTRTLIGASIIDDS